MVVQSKIAMQAAYAVSLAGIASAGSLADIDHVVLFMQENRAFDHYYGTMPGVRGFSDPNVQLNGDRSVWKQEAGGDRYLNPWYLNYLGGTWLNATQCMVAGSNGWSPNQRALNHGLNNHWVTNNTAWSWAHFQRSDIPVQFAIADGWTIADMYQESVIASTNPNRVTWISGSINVPGSPQSESEGGYPYIDNNESPGCDSDGINCYPLKWTTAGEIYEAQNVTWQVYQDSDNFDDNPYAWFEQFQSAGKSTSLYTRGMKGLSLDTFYHAAANGTLPTVSYIVGPTELSEHPPYSPRDGAWLQKKVVEAVINSPAYNRTALLISYDETGGFGDHVVPYHSPNGTVGEYLNDPWAGQGLVYSGPGFRVPFTIVSPWTRGGRVFTEHADHNSQIMFVEKWLAAKGYDVETPEMPAWRRSHMSDLTAAFDFDSPDYSLPELPYAIPPHTNSAGSYNGAPYCESIYPSQRPTVPYSGQAGSVDDVPSLSEEGFKPVRGQLTEGRYLVFETGTVALANPASGTSDSTTIRPVLTAATDSHSQKDQRWVVHVAEVGSNQFSISSAFDGRYLTSSGKLTSESSKAGLFNISFAPGKGYAFKNGCGAWLSSAGQQTVWDSEATYWKAYSVTYHN